MRERDQLGFLEKVEDHLHSVGHCQRCSSVVEPLVSLQWFVNLGGIDQPNSISAKAYGAVENGDIEIVPERFRRVYLNWLENIRDWCISRQLWWGHRIPVWYCSNCDHMTVTVDDPDTCESCGSEEIEQDADVLDTWFSSGLWPHSTLGWPDETQDLDYFYPTAVLETGYDILFFWVARMIMMGIENTGQVPFRTVFLHGLIRDATGAKMSKTRGNTMDPLELIDQYGTDALRFALTTGTAPGNDLRFGENRLEAARNFANKVWNASRFVISRLEGKCGLDGGYDLSDIEHREDRWIVSRLDQVTQGVNQSLRNFELGDAQQKLYDFFWNDYCDWYIEMAKIRIRSGDKPSPLPVLSHVLERTLRLLHPFMPFITEEVWQNLRAKLPFEGINVESIMVSEYPNADCPREDTKAEQEIGIIMHSVRAIRNARAQLRIPAAQRLEAKIEANGMQSLLEDEDEVIRSLSRVEPLHITHRDSGDMDLPKGVTLVVNPLVVHLPLEGVVDLSAEEERLRSELDDCLKNMERVEKLVSNQNFLEKAKAEVVETEHARLQDLKERRQHLNEILDQLTS